MNAKSLLQIAVLASAALIGSLAHANLVTNGDFEADPSTPAGWGVSGNGSNFVRGSFDGFTPFGSVALYFGCVGTLCGTTQTIATTAGANYVFSFEYGSDGGTPNEMMVNFDGATVFHTVNDDSDTRPGYLLQSFNVTASGASTLIEFLGSNDPSYQSIDNVSVVEAVDEVASITSVPEPTGVALAGLALLGLGLTRRKSM